MIKRIACMAMAGALAVVLAGCASSDGTSSSSTGSASNASTAQTVTFPQTYFVDTKTADEAIALLQSQGCTDIVANGDGTYTASLSGSAYQQLVGAQYDAAITAIDAMKNSQSYPNIADISYDDALTTVKITLKSDQPGLADTYAPAVAGLAATQYQRIAGKTVYCEVTVAGMSGAVLNDIVYPTAS